MGVQGSTHRKAQNAEGVNSGYYRKVPGCVAAPCVWAQADQNARADPLLLLKAFTISMWALELAHGAMEQGGPL